MIWIALIVEILDKQWPDVVVLLILQFVNGKGSADVNVRARM